MEKTKKKKIILYGGIALVYTAMISGGINGINIAYKELTTKHTEEICPITYYLESYEKGKGIKHQQERIQKEFQEQGRDVIVSYKDINLKSRTTNIEDQKVINFDGSITFKVNCKSTNSYIYPGYMAVKIVNGQIDESAKKVDVIVTYNEDGSITIKAPLGYTLVSTGFSTELYEYWYQDDMCFSIYEDCNNDNNKELVDILELPLTR